MVAEGFPEGWLVYITFRVNYETEDQTYDWKLFPPRRDGAEDDANPSANLCGSYAELEANNPDVKYDKAIFELCLQKLADGYGAPAYRLVTAADEPYWLCPLCEGPFQSQGLVRDLASVGKDSTKFPLPRKDLPAEASEAFPQEKWDILVSLDKHFSFREKETGKVYGTLNALASRDTSTAKLVRKFADAMNNNSLKEAAGATKPLDVRQMSRGTNFISSTSYWRSSLMGEARIKAQSLAKEKAHRDKAQAAKGSPADVVTTLSVEGGSKEGNIADMEVDQPPTVDPPMAPGKKGSAAEREATSKKVNPAPPASVNGEKTNLKRDASNLTHPVVSGVSSSSSSDDVSDDDENDGTVIGGLKWSESRPEDVRTTMRAFCLFSDNNNYYPGVVGDVHPDGKFVFYFDDNDVQEDCTYHFLSEKESEPKKQEKKNNNKNKNKKANRSKGKKQKTDASNGPIRGGGGDDVLDGREAKSAKMASTEEASMTSAQTVVTLSSSEDSTVGGAGDSNVLYPDLFRERRRFPLLNRAEQQSLAKEFNERFWEIR